jgi:hypothetical protein
MQIFNWTVTLCNGFIYFLLLFESHVELSFLFPFLKQKGLIVLKQFIFVIKSQVKFVQGGVFPCLLPKSLRLW